MRFDRCTIALLVTPDGGRPELDDEAARLQDARMRHLADLHESGALPVAGPLLGDRLRGLCVFEAKPEAARELIGRDPAVAAGVFSVEIVPSPIPVGAMTFSPTRFPRSVAEVGGSSAS
jgi:hypothetical protein